MFPFATNIPSKRWEIVTFVIVAINVLSLLWLNSKSELQQQQIVAHYGFVPERIEQLSNPNKVVSVGLQVQANWFGQVFIIPRAERLPADRTQIFESAITCMFLHGGWMHLIGNMWFLLIFGNNIEDRLGHGLYALFYLFGGLAATAVHWAIGPHSNVPIVGASGAIAAVLGAYAVTYPHARIKTLVVFVFITVIELPAFVFLIAWFAMQLFSGISALGGQMDGGVAWWAHVGGFAVGALTMLLLNQMGPWETPLQTDESDPWNQHRFPPGYDNTRWS